MALSINTNIASLNAQRNLSRSQGVLEQSLQRLSTGLRINSAKDDAAGLAIVERFTTQIRGLNQAARNANDGISLVQTTESVLGELSNNLQRIRELAIQSANATNSSSDRAALDNEVQQRLAEIDRIASQTSFNGLKVLDGTFGNAIFQVGANVGETISVNLNTGVRTNQIGQIATATGVRVTGNALTAGGLTIAVGQNAAVAIGASAGDSAADKVAAINAASVSGLTATAANTVAGAFTTTSNGAGDTFSLNINGTDIFTVFDLAANGALTGGEVATQINLFSSTTGVAASFNATTGDITLTTTDGRNIVADETVVGAGGIADAVAAAGGITTRGTVTLSATDNIAMTGEFAEIGQAATIAKDAVTLDSTGVTTVAAANDMINRIDSALSVVSTLRSELGAVQNRFESTIINLNSVSDSLVASRGRIQDADFAAETAALTRAQILQQAGISVLAQANAQPQLALSLLQ